MKVIFSILVIFIFHCSLIAADKEENATVDISNILDEYFKNLSQESALDYTIIFSDNKYYDDDSIQQADRLAFASKADDNPVMKGFNLSPFSKSDIKQFVRLAKKSGVAISFYQESEVDNVKTTEDFGTITRTERDSSAVNVISHPDGFVVGLETEIQNAMDLAENVATIQVLEYYEDGAVKHKTTTVVHSNKIDIIDSHKMSPRMVQSSAELLRKAYKLDMDSNNRAPFVTQLFEKEFPRFEWTVNLNSTAQASKKNIGITLVASYDRYSISGVEKQAHRKQ